MKRQYGGHQCLVKSSSIQMPFLQEMRVFFRGSAVSFLMLAFSPPSSVLKILVIDNGDFLENGSETLIKFQ
jgi:hypothetical protein